MQLTYPRGMEGCDENIRFFLFSHIQYCETATKAPRIHSQILFLDVFSTLCPKKASLNILIIFGTSIPDINAIK